MDIFQLREAAAERKGPTEHRGQDIQHGPRISDLGGKGSQHSDPYPHLVSCILSFEPGPRLVLHRPYQGRQLRNPESHQRRVAEYDTDTTSRRATYQPPAMAEQNQGVLPGVSQRSLRGKTSMRHLCWRHFWHFRFLYRQEMQDEGVSEEKSPRICSLTWDRADI